MWFLIYSFGFFCMWVTFSMSGVLSFMVGVLFLLFVPVISQSAFSRPARASMKQKKRSSSIDVYRRAALDFLRLDSRALSLIGGSCRHKSSRCASRPRSALQVPHRPACFSHSLHHEPRVSNAKLPCFPFHRSVSTDDEQCHNNNDHHSAPSRSTRPIASGTCKCQLFQVANYALVTVKSYLQRETKPSLKGACLQKKLSLKWCTFR